MRHKGKQEVEQAAAADSWHEQGLIFTTGIGTPFYSARGQTGLRERAQGSQLAADQVSDLRHTASSLMLNHGVSSVVVSKRLGHANPSITLSINAHATMDMQTHAADVMNEILSPTDVSKPDLELQAADSR